MQQQQQNKKVEEEGFTRSISLYWHWVRGQKAASKMGKVSRGLLGGATPQRSHHPLRTAARSRLAACEPACEPASRVYAV
jgi:hypothetical protein